MLQLHTLKSPQWLDAAIMDYWLHILLIDLGTMDIQYIPCFDITQEPNIHCINQFCCWFHLPSLPEECQRRPAVGFIHTNLYKRNTPGNHWTYFYFDLTKGELHLLGHNYKENST